MNAKLALLLPSLLLLCSADLQAQRRGGRGRGGPPPSFEHLRFELERFDSEALGRSTEFGIFLPADYDDAANAETSYPLVLWLHGLNEDHRRFASRGGGEVLDRMTGAGDLPPMVFVCVNGGNSFYIDGARDGSAFETMIADEMVAHIEKSYRVHTDRGRRAIAGVSMGGLGALKIALKQPERFGTVAAHSAAIMPRKAEDLPKAFPWMERWGGAQRLVGSIFGSPVDEDRWASENVLLMADSLQATDLSDLRIYFDCGTEDRYGFQDPNLELHQLLETKEIPHSWRLVDGGNHGWRSGYNQENLPYSLRFLAIAFAEAQNEKGGPEDR